MQPSPGLPRFDSFSKLPVARSAARKVLSYAQVRAGLLQGPSHWVLRKGRWCTNTQIISAERVCEAYETRVLEQRVEDQTKRAVCKQSLAGRPSILNEGELGHRLQNRVFATLELLISRASKQIVHVSGDV